MRVFYERPEHRSGALGAGDEEECFTALGRRTGVWLTTEAVAGDGVLSAEVDDADLEAYDVSGDDAREHRVFVVPSDVCAAWTFT